MPKNPYEPSYNQEGRYSSFHDRADAYDRQARRARSLSRQAKRFLAAEPAFDASIEYESDLDGLTRCHHSWVTSEEDLTEEGRAVRAYLKAHPDLIDQH